MRQQVLFSKAYQQMSILKPMSNSKIKVPTCTHKAFVESPTVVGMKVKDAIATVIHKALCEEGGIHSIFPYFMQVSVYFANAICKKWTVF